MKNNFSDFIAISCHYDRNTLLTRNGELLHVIEVKGFSKRFDSISDIRNAVRELLQSLMNDNLLFYIYVKRDYTHIDITSDFTSEFARMKHSMWMKDNNLNECLMNTLYIVVMHYGARSLYFTRTFFKNVFKIKKIFFNKLENAVNELSNVSVQILKSLEKYGVKLFSIHQDGEKFFSEPLSFLYYLIYAETRNIEISRVDYANILAYNLSMQNEYNKACIINNKTVELDFDGNIKLNTSEDTSHYIAMLSLKESYDLSKKYTDLILTLDQQMIISETIRICNKKTYLDEINKAREIYSASKMTLAIQKLDTHINDINSSNLVKSQILMKIFGPSLEVLNTRLLQTKKLLFNLGISTVREDYYMLGAFFSTIPGNSHLFRREVYNTLNKSGIFSSIKPKSLGGYNGSIWGQPITVFKTIDGLPYFFNFHNSKNIGHTIIVGKEENGLSMLMNFLVIESFKLNVKYTHLCLNTLSSEIITMCNGKVIENFSINMLKILDNDIVLFQKFISWALFQNVILSDEINEQLSIVMKQIYTCITENFQSIEQAENEIKNIIESKDLEINSDIKYILTQFFSHDCFFKAFFTDTQVDDTVIFIKNEFNNIPTLANNLKGLFDFLYIKQLNDRLQNVNTQPIIVTASHALLQLAFICKNEIIELFENLAKKHVVIIICCENKNELLSIETVADIIKSAVPTRFFLSDKFVDNKFRNIFELSHSEINKIKMYNLNEYIFLLKQDEDVISASFKVLNSIEIK